MRAYIPPNLDDNGGVLGGLVKKRNALEALIYIGFILLLVKILIPVVSPIVLIIAFVVLGIPGTILFLAGIDGQPISRMVIRRIRYKKNKGVFTLRMPIEEKDL